jgi:hypothetical protein
MRQAEQIEKEQRDMKLVVESYNRILASAGGGWLKNLEEGERNEYARRVREMYKERRTMACSWWRSTEICGILSDTISRFTYVQQMHPAFP